MVPYLLVYLFIYLGIGTTRTLSQVVYLPTQSLKTMKTNVKLIDSSLLESSLQVTTIISNI